MTQIFNKNVRGFQSLVTHIGKREIRTKSQNIPTYDSQSNAAKTFNFKDF